MEYNWVLLFIWYNDVFHLDALVNDSRYDYLGCFIDQESRELGGHFEEMGHINSPQACVRLCKEKGFAYAGLQYR